MKSISIAMTTIGRKSLFAVLEKLNNQSFDGQIQILLGLDIDKNGEFYSILDKFKAIQKNNVEIAVLDIGYSTSVRHGGIHTNKFGGSLRAALTFLAKYRFVTFLDDDDFPEENHLEELFNAVQGKSWAFTLCNFVNDKNIFLCQDVNESVGPGKGTFKAIFNGYVRPSALIVDKIKTEEITFNWSKALNIGTGDGDDRLIFSSLLKFKDFGETGKYTLNYVIDPKDGMHKSRVAEIKKQNPSLDISTLTKEDSAR